MFTIPSARGDRPRRPVRGLNHRIGRGDEDIDLEANQLRGQTVVRITLAFWRPELQADVLAFDVAELTQPLAECVPLVHAGCEGAWWNAADRR